MTTCTLTTVIRQSGDPLFMRILNQLRIGHLSQEAETLLRSCHLSIKAMPDDGILPTKLYCTNKNVDMENIQQLKKLCSPSHLFRCTDKIYQYPETGAKWMNQAVQSLLTMSDKKIPRVLELKVGAQVVLLRNTDDTLVNGSRGVVVGFQNYDIVVDAPVVAANDASTSKTATVVGDAMDIDESLSTTTRMPNAVWKDGPTFSILFKVYYYKISIPEKVLQVDQIIQNYLENIEGGLDQMQKDMQIKYEYSPIETYNQVANNCNTSNPTPLQVLNYIKNISEEREREKRTTNNKRRRCRDEGNPIVRFDNGRTIVVNP
jgi:hypothetical protein